MLLSTETVLQSVYFCYNQRHCRSRLALLSHRIHMPLMKLCHAFGMAITHILSKAASWPSLFVIVLLISALILSKTCLRRNKLPMPPGPPAEPLLGHIHVVPASKASLSYMKWSKEYQSDILSFNMLSQRLVVLNSVRAAKDLLAIRSAIYSDRPQFTVYESMGFDRTLAFLRWNGPFFRLHRRLAQTYFLKHKMSRYEKSQQREVSVVLKKLASDPASNVEQVMARFSASIIFAISYGIKIQSDDSPFLKMAADVSYAVSNGGAVIGSPVDFLPFLVHLPSWLQDKALRWAAKWRPAITKVHDDPFQFTKDSPPDQSNCFARELINREEQLLEKGLAPEMDEHAMKGLATTLNMAGYETTWATTTFFLHYMVLHPEVQLKAQKILDEVVGRDRLPTLDDQHKLPYIDYIINEVLRINPAVPLGIPHRLIQDDEYDGYFIPAGSTVIANTYAMMHDDRVYSSPEKFDPGRYAPIENGGKGEPLPVGHFGFGRRICPGRHLAEASIWLATSSILSTMSIEKRLGEEDVPIAPRSEVTNGLTSHLVELQCRVRPRDEISLRVIDQLVV